jgi:hypothetical protein
MAMSKIEARGTEPTDGSDWNHAWSVIAQLAAARGAALRELGEGSAGLDHDDVRETQGAPAAPDTAGTQAGDGLAGSRRAHAELVSCLLGADGPDGPAGAPEPFAPVAPDQLARDIAEIEQAAAALRHAEPALEPQMPPPAPGPQERPEQRERQPIWLLVGVIWLTAVAVVSCAVGTVALLLS